LPARNKYRVRSFQNTYSYKVIGNYLYYLERPDSRVLRDPGVLRSQIEAGC
jgi:hypothetical protein